ncbi:FixJ family two-component response regulator [Bradyrhizobium sp. cir1]|uniref:response regulator transcription factor n=1 Tax=Bradyrhizobium sp. cir1 TaxID=1445730 RepID=UPI001606CD87|nr:response regulator [Bradyrhizobium sp. cir1]MBB4369533.1 FixJ family two-component response regulator [Bradyrhizobium sp. cir1]
MPGIVHVVDDDASYLSAIQQVLEAGGYRVATYASAQQLLERQPGESKGCILLDVRMPGMSGLELQNRLTERGSTLPIIFLSAYPDVSITVRAIKAGADDFFIKPVGADDLLSAIARAIARHRNARELDGELEALRARLSTLTPRQRQVFEIIVQGKTNKHAARELGSTERTIKAHRSAIMDKLQVQSVVELVRIAERLGVLGEKDEPDATS